jgi:GNAT superfamily N-acetyltransferase
MLTPSLADLRRRPETAAWFDTLEASDRSTAPLPWPDEATFAERLRFYRHPERRGAGVACLPVSKRVVFETAADQCSGAARSCLTACRKTRLRISVSILACRSKF